MARQYGPCARTARPPPKASTTRFLVTTSHPTAKRIFASAAWDHARGPRVARVRSGGDHGVIMADGSGGLCGDMRVERGAQRGQVQVAVDAAELAAGFDHSGGAPAQCHGAVLPVLHVARVVAGDGDHRLDAVGACLLSLIHISEPTRLGMISYAVFCL